MQRISGKLLKKLRKEHGFSLRTFAQKIYVSKSSVQRWEQTFVPENEDILNCISNLFNISIEDLRKQSQNEYSTDISPEKLAEMRLGLRGFTIILSLLISLIFLFIGLPTLIFTIL